MALNCDTVKDYVAARPQLAKHVGPPDTAASWTGEGGREAWLCGVCRVGDSNRLRLPAVHLPWRAAWPIATVSPRLHALPALPPQQWHAVAEVGDGSISFLATRAPCSPDLRLLHPPSHAVAEVATATRAPFYAYLRLLHPAPSYAVAEVGDGNINFVYILHGPAGALCLKQALPFVRCVGEGWPLTQVRPPRWLAGSWGLGHKRACSAALPFSDDGGCLLCVISKGLPPCQQHHTTNCSALPPPSAGSRAHRGRGAGGGGGCLPAARAGGVPLRCSHVHHRHAGKARLHRVLHCLSTLAACKRGCRAVCTKLVGL